MPRVNARKFPKFHRKFSEEPLFRSEDFISGFPSVPEKVIFVYSNALADLISRELDLSPTPIPYGDRLPVRCFINEGRSIIMTMPGVGAPMTATVTDEFRALGAKNFLILGYAGGLSPTLRINDLVLCTKALRDDGVSHHLLPPSLYVHPSADLLAFLKESLKQGGLPFRAGPTWTMDFPYSETKKEVAAYRNLGILTVEMEAASLFAIGKARKLRTAAAFVISDTLTEEKWSGMHDTSAGFPKLVEVAKRFVLFDSSR